MVLGFTAIVVVDSLVDNFDYFDCFNQYSCLLGGVSTALFWGDTCCVGIRDNRNKFIGARNMFMGRGSFSTACVGIKCLISWVKDMFTICAGVRVSWSAI